jgi:gas vesicle protein
MNKDSGAGFFTGLIVGAVIELAVGLLYAPHKGEETRRVVKEKVTGLKDTAAQAARKAGERIKQKVQSGEQET